MLPTLRDVHGKFPFQILLNLCAHPVHCHGEPTVSAAAEDRKVGQEESTRRKQKEKKRRM
jgi:hypothetical protein